MKHLRVLTLAACAALTTSLLSGCGPSLGTASGQITYEGTPVGTGYITFTPADGKGKDAGGAITDGKYQVTGLSPGPKIVKVIAVKKVNFASTSAEMMRRAAEARNAGNYDGLVDPADTIPENAQGNNVQVDIRAGENPLNFDLKKPAKGN